jgi:hypothetical protein
MEQTLSATWIEVLAGAAAGAVIIVGGIWAVVGVLLSDLKRDYRTMQCKWMACTSPSTTSPSRSLK